MKRLAIAVLVSGVRSHLQADLRRHDRSIAFVLELYAVVSSAGAE